MNNIYIGIDNGLKGAVAVLEGNKEPVLYDTPTTTIKIAGKERDTFVKEEMVDILEKYSLLSVEAHNFSMGFSTPPIKVRVMIEETIAMPKQSSQSGHTTGYGKGLWHGILATHRIKFEEVTIKDWQQHFGIYGKGKNTKKKAFAVASALFPKVRLTGPRGGILDGRCDALLIAEFNRRWNT